LNLVEYLARATEYLDRHGISSPRLNAELLLCHQLGITRLEIYTNFDKPLAEADAGAYRRMLLERAGGRPLQLITGETCFRGLTLEVRPGVFIPRPETEVLVEAALEVLPVEGAGLRVLDLGSGCGNVALSIASERDEAEVTTVEVDQGAVELTRANIEKTGLAGRVTAIAGDLFEPLAPDALFDLIISNPPYVPEGMRESLPAEVADFEPAAALFAGPEGLDVITRIVEGAPARLAPGGWLALEVDESHASSVGSTLESQGWAEVDVLQDLAGRQRVARARRRD